MKLQTSAYGVVLSLAFVCIAMGQDQGENKKELEKLQGAWGVVASQVGDEKTPEEELKKRKVTIKGNFLTYEFGTERKEKREGTIKLDPKTKYLDWTASLPQAPTALAIYELNGNDLKIGFGNDGLVRPRRFVMGTDDVAWLLVLKRAVPDPVSDEMKKLEGTWIAAAIESGGKKAEGEEFKKMDLDETLVINDGSSRTINKEGKELKSKITIDSTKKPKTLDRAFTVKGDDLVARSIYTLDDDTLRICSGFENQHVRPRAFTQDGTYVMVYNRQEVKKERR